MSAVLLGVMLCDAWLAARLALRTGIFGNRGAALTLLTTRRQSRDLFDPFYFVADAGDAGPTFRLLDLDAHSAGELARLIGERPDALVQAHFVLVCARSGLLAPAVQATAHRLRVTRVSDGTQANPDQAGLARAALAAHFRASGWAESAAILERADGYDRHVLWPGVVHDGVALAGWGTLVYSLGWIRGLFHRRARLLAQSRCAVCRYDLAAVPRSVAGEVRCPECGSVWTLPGQAAARAARGAS